MSNTDKVKESSNEVRSIKTAHLAQNQGLVLIPQPTEDPKDPLNWPAWKKYTILFVLCFASFSGGAGTNANQLAYVLQAPTYNKSATAMSYGSTASVAGLFGGPLLLAPFSHVIGRSSLIFWSLLGVLATQIWAACMTGKGDYISFIISRLMAGIFASIPTIVTPSFIMDLFFLHQRGRCFACLEISLLSAYLVSPTLGGFIVQSKPWPFTFWWTIAPIGLSIILVGIFLEESGFPRGKDTTTLYPKRPATYLNDRIATFLPGTKVVPSITGHQLLKVAIAPLEIGISPITILAGFYCFVAFGFTILINIITTIILQTPEKVGGYGFSALQNALFSLTAWVSIIAAQIVGQLLGDRIPLTICRTLGHGVWHPEYRLWNMLAPGLLGPIGLGLFGAALQHHLHYMVLAVGFFLVMFSSILSIPICLNYVVECFLGSSDEVAVVMNCYRQGFAIGLGFFVFPWEGRVGAGWTFGMAALFDALAAGGIGILVWRGRSLRRDGGMGWGKRVGGLWTEEGEHITVGSWGGGATSGEE